MVSEERMGTMPPTVSLSPPINWQREDPHWRHFDNSINAVSFGFVATAILISMFLVMAVFERFIRPPPPTPTLLPSSNSEGNHHREARGSLEWKLSAGPPSPKGYWHKALLDPTLLPHIVLEINYAPSDSYSNFREVANKKDPENAMISTLWNLEF